MKIHCPKCASTHLAADSEQDCPRYAGGKETVWFSCLDCGKKFRQKDALVALGTVHPLVKELGHPVRVAIMLQLSLMGELSPNRISRRIGEDIGTVSYHMKVLRELEPPAVELTKTEPVRGAVEHFYKIADLA